MPREPRIQGLKRWLRMPRAVGRDVDDEIRFHLESRVAELVGLGHSADGARQIAEAEFGDISASRRELTAVDRRSLRRASIMGWLEALSQDLRHAARTLRRSAPFTATAGLTLVIGIGACVAMFAVVNGVLLRPLPFGRPDRLVAALHDMPPIGLTHQPQSASTYFTYQRLAHTIDAIGVYDETAVNVSESGGAGEPQRVTCAFISASLIPLLDVAPLVGRSFTSDEDRPNGALVIVISEGLWRTRFGADRRILERALDVNGVSRHIIGVMPERFHFPARATQIWLPLALDPVALDARAYSHPAVARLKAGVSIADARRDLASVLPRIVELFPNFVPGLSTRQMMEQVKPVPVLVPLHDDITGGVAATLWMLAAAAALVLLVACANVVNLTLVRADARQREFGVREALGAGRARIAMHLFAESALLAGLSSAIGLGVATLVVRWLVGSGPVDIPRLVEVRIDASAILFTFAVAALVSLLCGLVPTIRVLRSARRLVDGSRGAPTSRAQHRVRGTLVTAQIALSLVVLAASGLLLRTFDRLHSVRLGFDPEHLATFWVSLPRGAYASDTSIMRFYRDLTDRVRGLAGVKSAGITSRLPLESYGANPNPLYPENDPSWATRLPPLQLFTTVDGDYFHTMGITLVAGRNFARVETQRPDEAIISSETAASFWKDATGIAALGKRFRPLPGSSLFTVIGVVSNAHDSTLTDPPSPTVYFPEVVGTDANTKPIRRTMALVVRTVGDPTGVTSSVRRIIRDLDRTLPTFDVRPMTAVVDASMARLTLTLGIVGFAAVVSLLLGTIGLYGVLAYLVTLRTRELGIRIALGATPRAVASAMTRYGVMLSLAGTAAGLLVFGFVARFLRAFLFGVAATDPVTLSGASATLLAIAALASWVPARRAARIDPVDALRAE